MCSDTTMQAAPQPPVIFMVDKVVQRPLAELSDYQRGNRVHTSTSIASIAASIRQFGFVTPILIDAKGVIIAGHGRCEAAKMIGLPSVPVVVVEHLSEAEVRALRIADNKLPELSNWNREALQIEFAELMELSLEGELDFDLTVTGFEMAEIDLIIGSEGDEVSEAETVEEPDRTKPAVTRPGDLWVLGHHRIYCGDSLVEGSFDTVLKTETAVMAFIDSPFNVPVVGHVRSGKNSGHREFAMASGEMSEDEFMVFLVTFIALVVARMKKGAVVMLCMDWRHIDQLIIAAKKCGLELINLCVWNKTNGGMGSLYRSKHELVGIFRKPGAPHINNVELGKHGRNRTNVWDYAGVNSFGKGREADLADHPTVKPTALVADAIMDVTHRGDIVLDCFGGSGSTLLAAEKTGRKARLIELDPIYVDVTIRRWQATTGQKALHAVTGETFDERARMPETSSTTEASHVDA